MSILDWTYGCEHELVDWDRSPTKLPACVGFNKQDYTMCNSNGIGVDPIGKTHTIGGELNTVPTDTMDGQVEILSDIKRAIPTATVTYRSALHIHIRVPGLKDDLKALKRLAKYNAAVLPHAIPRIYPVPLHKTEWEAGEKRWWRSSLTSRCTLLPKSRTVAQLDANTVKEFFEAEVPRSKRGAVMWHAQPRAAVNLRQLLQTDTIEFRHFAGTLNEIELRNALRWCRFYLVEALISKPGGLGLEHSWLFPQLQPYSAWMERRYRATCHDGTLTRELIAQNIKDIYCGAFDGRKEAA